MKLLTLDTRLSKGISIAFFILLVGLTVAVYYSSLFYGFIFDDYPNIVKLFEIRHKGFFDLFFAHSRWITYWLNTVYYKIARFEPFAYRLGNLIIHILNGSLLWSNLLLLFSITPKTARNGQMKDSIITHYAYPLAFLTTGLFLLHPVQTQTVCYVIQGQLEGCALLSILLAIFIFILFTRVRALSLKILLAVALMGVGAFSAGTKEIAIVAPLLLVLVDWFFIAAGRWADLKNRLWLHALFAFTVLACFCYVLKPGFFLNLVQLKVSQVNNAGNILTDKHVTPITPYSFFISQFKVIVHYLFIFFWPFNLSADYNWKLSEGFWSADSIMPCAFLCMIGVWLVVKLRKNPVSLVVFSFFWFFVAIFPRASLFASAELVADYKTYPASLGMCLLLAVGLVYTSAWLAAFFHAYWKRAAAQPLFWSALSGLLIWEGFLTAKRMRVWRSPEDFWRAVMSHDAPKARAFNNYAVALIENRRYKEALPYLERAIKMDSVYADPWNNLAIAYGKLDQIDKAIGALQQALTINPHHAEGYSNLATFFIAKKEYEAAEAALRQALMLRKHYGKALFKLGRLKYFQDNIEEAHTYFKRCCTQGDFDMPDGFASWGMTSMILKKYDEALEAYGKAVQLSPKDDDLLGHLAHAFLFNRDFKRAEELFTALHKRHPRDIQTVLGLAEVFTVTKRYEKALALYKKAEPSAVGMPMVLLRLAGCYYKLDCLDEAESYLIKFLEANPSEDAASKARSLLDALQKGDFGAKIWAWLD